MERGKQAAAAHAATWIESGMTVGLGTGSTAIYFIQSLAKRIEEDNLKIVAGASSYVSEALAKSLRIDVRSIDDFTSFDLTVDGADEIDPKKRMIKGGGGAHVREKIVAKASSEPVIIVDETKLVAKLGGRPLPLEILPFGSRLTERHIEALGFSGQFRPATLSDNGNLLFDLTFDTPDVEELDLALRAIPGVVETGFFFDMAGRVIVGREDGTVFVT